MSGFITFNYEYVCETAGDSVSKEVGGTDSCGTGILTNGCELLRRVLQTELRSSAESAVNS